MVQSDQRVVYVVWYNSCIYESAPATISIHLTKAGAYKALRKMLWGKAVADRDNAIRWGGRDYMRNYKVFEDTAHGIKTMPLEQ